MIVDANYILRWFLGDVETQATEVQKLLDNAHESSLVCDRVSLAEVTYVLRGKGYDNKQITTVLREFANYPSVALYEDTENRALDIYSATTLDFEDCVIIARSLTSGQKIASFDKKLQKTAEKLASQNN